jgi:3-hydroxyacyl-CoA dehydrogenase
MTAKLARHGEIAVVTVDNPPVNAMSHAARQALHGLAETLDEDPAVAAVVLCGAGRNFIGGADIREFGRPVEPPSLPEVIARIEGARKPWIAAIHGAALGGGLEVALGCHYRIAAAGAVLGLPEVSLGIIPGAGGTQRLPRLIGVRAAIPVVAEMKKLSPAEALDVTLIAQVAEGELIGEAVALARRVAAMPLPVPASERIPEPVEEAVWTEAERRIAKAAKGAAAPLRALGALRFGIEHGFADGLRNERKIFLELRDTEEAAALRHLFFAERAALRPAALKGITPTTLATAGVVGGGTMGAGIAAALCNAGLTVVLAERDAESLAQAKAALGGLYDASVKRGSLSAELAAERLGRITGIVGLDGLAACDLVIEAVFEDIAVKRAVFARLGEICRPETVLATNTSYLDPRRIAQGLPDRGRFLGLHFFSPAHVMKLLEIVPLPETRPETVAMAFDLAARLGKIPVQSGICEGFIGNRILRRYRAAAEDLLLSGVPCPAIDAAMRGYGLAMGPFEAQDLAGLDIAFMYREAARARGEADPDGPGDVLARAGRKGQKSGGGWYDYKPGDRTPHPSAETARLLAPLLAPARDMADEDIAARLVDAMAAEGRAILDEGIAANAADIDLVEVHGYGFPRRKGGPMFQASRRT